MKKIVKWFKLIVFITFVVFSNSKIFAQKEIAAIVPTDGESNVNIGILKWSGQTGMKYDLYFGTSSNPELFKSDLEVTELKPLIFELNKKYYWKIVEKKDEKVIRTSMIFTFTTLPITLNPTVEYKSIVDLRDYKVYWTMTIGNKEWFVQNLDYDLPNMSWYYNNSAANRVYGKLYSGNSLTTNQNDICPEGWRIPALEEWTDLINTFGGIKVAGSSLKEKSELYWRSSNYNHTNISGFTVLPAGSRDNKPSYANLGKYTFFWSSTPNVKVPNSYNTVNIGFMRDNLIIEAGDENWGYSIRCVKDK